VLLRAPATAGIDVKTEIEGQPYALPGPVDVAAYRIAQESLTNVMRHAKASCAEVALRYQPEFVELEVRDDGPGPVRTNGHGHGLAGMRERAESLGGSFSAGPLPGGGFRVWTRLPTASGA
jgi:signal transduction histidine kinase